MKKILYITGLAGSGKTTALKKLAGDNPVVCLSTTTESPLRHMSGPIFIDDYRMFDSARLQILIDNPQVTSIVVASEK